MSQPNVLLIVLDAVRKNHLSCYGHRRKTTPNLDEFATEAKKYESAVAAAPWTPPSHASLFTGKYPSQHRVTGFNPHLDSDHETVAELLANEGYTTFGFSNSHHTSAERGFDRGFGFYHDILELPRVRGRMYELSRAYIRFVWKYFVQNYDVSYFQLRKLVEYIEDSSEPFFGFINLNSAHSPYDPPEPWASELEDGYNDWDKVSMETAQALADDGGYQFMMGELDAKEIDWELVRRWYDGEIRYMDYLLKELFTELKDRGMYEESLIIVTSDHGEHFGEHGLAYHQFSLYEQLLAVPLLMKWPQSTQASTSEELVSLVDITPTILDAAGVGVPESMRGRSVRSGQEPNAVFAEYAGPYPPLRERLEKYGDAFDGYDRGLQAVRTSERKLIRSTSGESTLYRISEDAEVKVDEPTRKEKLGKVLTDQLNELPRGGEVGEPDDHIKNRLKKLGYM